MTESDFYLARRSSYGALVRMLFWNDPASFVDVDLLGGVGTAEGHGIPTRISTMMVTKDIFCTPEHVPGDSMRTPCS